MLELFSQEEAHLIPIIPNGELQYYPAFLSAKQADNLYHELYNATPWQKDKITVFGKTYDQPKTSHSPLCARPYSLYLF